MEQIIKAKHTDGKIRTLYLKCCEFCNNGYYARKDVKSRFCSNSCKQNYRRENSAKQKYTCFYCGKEFEAYAKGNLGKKNYCCRSHKDADRLYNNKNKSEYRYRALKFYGESCADCGYELNSSMLDVHHIDGNRKNNTLENLRVLCVWCHALETRRVNRHGWIGCVQ